MNDLLKAQGARDRAYSQEYPGGVNVVTLNSVNLPSDAVIKLGVAVKLAPTLVAKWDSTALRLFAITR